MRLISNERGSALIITLIVIVVFTILGLTLLAGTINSAKQIKKTEEEIQVTHLAEMGIEFYQSEINKFIEDKQGDVLTSVVNLRNTHLDTSPNPIEHDDHYYKSEALRQLYEVLKGPNGIDHHFTTNNINNPLQVSSNSLFKIQNTDTSDWSHNPSSRVNLTHDTTNKEIQISLYVLGKKNNKISSPIRATFTVIEPELTFERSGAGGSGGDTSLPFPENPGGLSTVQNYSVTSTQSISGHYINENLTFNKNHYTLTVNGDLYIKGQISVKNHNTIQTNHNLYLNTMTNLPNAEIIVRNGGKAFLYGNITRFKTNPGNQGFLCVEGEINLNSGINITESDVNTFSGGCANISNNQRRGIYAHSVNTMSTDSSSGTSNSIRFWDTEISVTYR